ncbi:MAG: ABC transporter permease [Planctomycetota bacterium]|nr:ABC transporter permease [Planctomycetota bacterium]MDA1212079.1 ABC transporter permease [Planctomycetota bacterium]
MNLFSISFHSLRQRWLSSSMTLLSVALGVMLMVTVLIVNGIMDRMFSQSASGYDLIIGPKGSALQLVLNSIYRVSAPIENLPYLYYLELLKDKRIENAIPLAIGDVTQEGAFPIVGTVSKFFDVDYIPGKRFRVKGDYLQQPFDSVIGSVVARENGWGVGDQFTMVHGGAEGHVHDEKFTIRGVLAPTGTPNDKTVFVHLEGFYLLDDHEKPGHEAVNRWREFNGLDPLKGDELQAEIKRWGIEAHDHATHGEEDGHHHHAHGLTDIQKEVTAVLINMAGKKYGAFAQIQFENEMKEGFKAQAANPAKEIYWLMTNVVGSVRAILVVLTGLIIIVSGVGIFVSIYNSMSERKKEIAIMRALGASRGTVFSIILLESILLCVGGGLGGVLLGHGLVFLSADIIEGRTGVLINPWAFEIMEVYVVATMVVLASVVGFIPGVTAYRTDVAQTLSS